MGKQIRQIIGKFATWVVVLFCLSVTCGAEPAIVGAKFSAEEIQLLKIIDRIEVGAGISSSMLKAAPFVQLLSAENMADHLVTIAGSDWEYIGAALIGLAIIKSCRIVEEIEIWKSVDGNSYSSQKTQQFFEAIRARADKGC